MLGARQLALSVEIAVPISLCWGPANSHIIVSCIFASFCVGARQYNTLGPIILIYVSGSNPKILITYLYNLSPFDAITC